MTSYKLFGISVDGSQTFPRFTNNDDLQEKINELLSSKKVEKVVIIKNYI